MEREHDSSDIRVTTAIWKQREPSAFELAVIDRTSGGYRLGGDIAAGDADNEIVTAYSIDVNASWETRRVTVTMKQRRGPERRLELQPNAARRWSVRGASNGSWMLRSEFDGLIDVDLGCTPATNLLPIRRFDLDVGASAETTAVWVTFPTLDIVRLPQRYTRLSEREYRYESFVSDFTAILEVDDFGVVDRYSDIWIRQNTPR